MAKVALVVIVALCVSPVSSADSTNDLSEENSQELAKPVFSLPSFPNIDAVSDLKKFGKEVQSNKQGQLNEQDETDPVGDSTGEEDVNGKNSLGFERPVASIPLPKPDVLRGGLKSLGPGSQQNEQDGRHESTDQSGQADEQDGDDEGKQSDNALDEPLIQIEQDPQHEQDSQLEHDPQHEQDSKLEQDPQIEQDHPRRVHRKKRHNRRSRNQKRNENKKDLHNDGSHGQDHEEDSIERDHYGDSNESDRSSNPIDSDDSSVSHDSDHPGDDSDYSGDDSYHPGDESDHSGDESDHPGDESDHSGDESDHSGDESDHSGDESDHSGDDSDHSGRDSDHSGDGSDHSGRDSDHPGDGSYHSGDDSSVEHHDSGHVSSHNHKVHHYYHHNNHPYHYSRYHRRRYYRRFGVLGRSYYHGRYHPYHYNNNHPYHRHHTHYGYHHPSSYHSHHHQTSYQSPSTYHVKTTVVRKDPPVKYSGQKRSKKQEKTDHHVVINYPVTAGHPAYGTSPKNNYYYRGEAWENLCHPYCHSVCDSQRATCFDVTDLRNCEMELYQCQGSCNHLCGCVQHCPSKCNYHGCERYGDLFSKSLCEGRHSQCKNVCRERCPNNAFTVAVSNSLYGVNHDINTIFDNLND